MVFGSSQWTPSRSAGTSIKHCNQGTIAHGSQMTTDVNSDLPAVPSDGLPPWTCSSWFVVRWGSVETEAFQEPEAEGKGERYGVRACRRGSRRSGCVSPARVGAEVQGVRYGGKLPRQSCSSFDYVAWAGGKIRRPDHESCFQDPPGEASIEMTHGVLERRRRPPIAGASDAPLLQTTFQGKYGRLLLKDRVDEQATSYLRSVLVPVR